MPRPREGYLWTPKCITEGLETDSVSSSSDDLSLEYDVVIVGSGFAGLVAARDVKQYRPGFRVLLIEGRDRIGGRTWTVKIHGEEFEMGGTWVHWNQPHVYSELHRYNLHRNLKTSAGTFSPTKILYRPANSAIQEVDGASWNARSERVAQLFFAIDGLDSRSLMPFPHDLMRDPAPWKSYDHLTIRARLDQVAISQHEKDVFESLANTLGSAPASEIGFTDLLRWYALGGHSMAGMFELAGVYEIGKGGMTSLARAILEDYDGDRIFNTCVTEIRQETSAAALKLSGKRAFGTSTFSESTPGDATSTGSASSSPFVFAFSDHNGTQSSGPQGTYAIGFGYNNQLKDKTAAAQIIASFQSSFAPNVEVQSYFTHDWMNDPLANGAWSCWEPNCMSLYLEELQKPHGRIISASADWADGWRGFVDGAIEQGRKAAVKIQHLLRQSEATVEAVN